MGEQKNEITKKESSPALRFTTKVLAEYGTGVGDPAMSESQRRLAQNYFVAIDMMMKTADEKRKKAGKESLAVTWENVNLPQLARDVVTYSRMGLDPMQPNHISPVPYKNSTTKKYDIRFTEGYRGLELIAKKYGLDIPDHVVVELVYSTDKFRSIKKDSTHQFESYVFEITNDFDRGKVVGGFYYHVFADEPVKNKLVTLTLADIMKRKPQWASKEFWGEETWYEKMCYKTVFRAAYKDITIDSQKIDDDYLRIKQLEQSFATLAVETEIEENANTELLDIPEDTEFVAEGEPEQQEVDTGF